MVLAIKPSSLGAALPKTVSPLSLVDQNRRRSVWKFRVSKKRGPVFIESELASRSEKLSASGGRFLVWAGISEVGRQLNSVRPGRSTGKTLSDQLIGAFAESILVAVYLPDGNMKPQGNPHRSQKPAMKIRIKQALQSWSALDPNHVTQTREHRGQQSYVRPREIRGKFVRSCLLSEGVRPNLSSCLDHESLVQDAVDFPHRCQVPKTASSVRKNASDSSVPVLKRIRQHCIGRIARGLPNDGAAFLYRECQAAWDKVLPEDATRQSARYRPRSEMPFRTCVGDCHVRSVWMMRRLWMWSLTSASRLPHVPQLGSNLLVLPTWRRRTGALAIFRPQRSWRLSSRSGHASIDSGMAGHHPRIEVARIRTGTNGDEQRVSGPGYLPPDPAGFAS